MVEVIVDQVSDPKVRVAGMYNRATYLSEKRQRFELWAPHVAALVTNAKHPTRHGHRMRDMGLTNCRDKLQDDTTSRNQRYDACMMPARG